MHRIEEQEFLSVKTKYTRVTQGQVVFLVQIRRVGNERHRRSVRSGMDTVRLFGPVKVRPFHHLTR